MLYALIANDKPNGLAHRMEVRPGSSQDTSKRWAIRLVLAGPFLDAQGRHGGQHRGDRSGELTRRPKRFPARSRSWCAGVFDSDHDQAVENRGQQDAQMSVQYRDRGAWIGRTSRATLREHASRRRMWPICMSLGDRFVIGGPLLDDEGREIGSMVVIEAEDRAGGQRGLPAPIRSSITESSTR